MMDQRSILTLYGEKRWMDSGDVAYASAQIQHALHSLTHYANALSQTTVIESVSLATHMYRSEYDQAFVLLASATIVYSGTIPPDFFDMYAVPPNQHTVKVTI